MPTNRTEHTGNTYGAATVVKAINGRTWKVHWLCCGRTQTVSNERASNLSRTTPSQCMFCNREINEVPHTNHSVARTKVATSIIINGVWWPLIFGPMGPRHGRGGHD